MRNITAETPVVSPEKEGTHLGLVLVVGIILAIASCVAAGDGFKAAGVTSGCTCTVAIDGGR